MNKLLLAAVAVLVWSGVVYAHEEACAVHNRGQELAVHFFPNHNFKKLDQF